MHRYCSHCTPTSLESAASVRADIEQWIRDAEAREQHGADNEEGVSEGSGTDQT